MPYAFGHLVGSWIIGKLYEKKNKKSLHNLVWFFLLLGAVFPDSDYLIEWLFKIEFHRMFTHSLIFLLIASFLVFVFSEIISKQNKEYALFFGLGILIHLILDSILAPGIMLFWPSKLLFSVQGISNYSLNSFQMLDSGSRLGYLKWAIFDMGIGTAWMFWLIINKNINFSK
ncbi:metal-dependent hydrolase [Candidatus Woesearchaeota archaeon]|nr:metal-dependent hydrolase [Candidatus Woesearchaeota archaeon]